MKHTCRRGGWIALAIAVGLSLSACSGGSSGADTTDPSSLESIPGSDVSRVSVSPDAAKRLDLAMDKVSSGADGMTIPYAAVLYDPDGKTWAFTQVGELSFKRAPITIDHIAGDTAYLTDGPPAGTKVVTVGASELFGIEIGVEGE